MDQKSIKKSNQRQKFIINPKFQWNFIGIFIGVSIVNCLVVLIAHSIFFYQYKQKGLNAGIKPDHVFFKFIEFQENSMLLIYSITAIVMVILMGLAALFLSHRIAGPIHRLHKHMLQVSKGEHFREVFFRRGDYFTELSDAYNMQREKLISKDDI